MTLAGLFSPHKLSETELTFFLFGLLVTNREADWDSSMKDVAVSIAAMI